MSGSRYLSRAEKDRWQIERERFQLTDPRPPRAYRVFTPEQVLPKLMKQVGLEQPLWERTLIHEWPDLVGEDVAAHTRPGRLERKTLYVYVKNSVWLYQLRGPNEKAMLERIQARLGRERITGLRLALDPGDP